MSDEAQGERSGKQRAEAAPADFVDPVVEAYKRDVDRTLLRENLKLTPGERLEQLARFLEAIAELRRGNERAPKSRH